MKQGYILTEVSCKTCNMSVRVNPVIVESLEALKTGAAQVHSEFDGGVICPKPLLVEIYLPCLVSNEIFKPVPQLIIPNGH